VHEAPPQLVLNLGAPPSLQNAQIHYLMVLTSKKSRDGSVGLALGYGLDDHGSRVRFPEEAGNVSLHHRVQNSSGAHPASDPMGARGTSNGG
jgi:hypothetical protein